jgi:MFS family permease
MGWYMVMFAVASVLGPGIGGAIYQVNPNAVWYVSLAVGVLVLIGFQLLALRMREGADETLEESIDEAADKSPADPYHELQPGQPLIGIPESV